MANLQHLESFLLLLYRTETDYSFISPPVLIPSFSPTAELLEWWTSCSSQLPAFQISRCTVSVRWADQLGFVLHCSRTQHQNPYVWQTYTIQKGIMAANIHSSRITLKKFNACATSCQPVWLRAVTVKYVPQRTLCTQSLVWSTSRFQPCHILRQRGIFYNSNQWYVRYHPVIKQQPHW